MLEKEFNTIVRRSLERGGNFGFKIADPNQAVFRAGKGAIKNPFDGFGCNPDRAVYWESKIFTGKTFKLAEMRDHQIANLKMIWEMETGGTRDRKFLPVIIVARERDKKMWAYFITPEQLLRTGEVDLNRLPAVQIRSKELMVNWLKSSNDLISVDQLLEAYDNEDLRILLCGVR